MVDDVLTIKSKKTVTTSSASNMDKEKSSKTVQSRKRKLVGDKITELPSKQIMLQLKNTSDILLKVCIFLSLFLYVRSKVYYSFQEPYLPSNHRLYNMIHHLQRPTSIHEFNIYKFRSRGEFAGIFDYANIKICTPVVARSRKLAVRESVNEINVDVDAPLEISFVHESKANELDEVSKTLGKFFFLPLKHFIYCWLLDEKQRKSIPAVSLDILEKDPVELGDENSGMGVIPPSAEPFEQFSNNQDDANPDFGDQYDDNFNMVCK
jgi:hypothetical protein